LPVKEVEARGKDKDGTKSTVQGEEEEEEEG
jgi:hypothetical protein